MSEEKQVTVRVVRGFLNNGAFVDEGATIVCGEMRARDLERNRLVERVAEEPSGDAGGGSGEGGDGSSNDGDAGDEGGDSEEPATDGAQKKTQEPSNKRAKDPKNKS